MPILPRVRSRPPGAVLARVAASPYSNSTFVELGADHDRDPRHDHRSPPIESGDARSATRCDHLGYEPLEEILDYWPGNPCLILVKVAGAAPVG